MVTWGSGALWRPLRIVMKDAEVAHRCCSAWPAVTLASLHLLPGVALPTVDACQRMGIDTGMMTLLFGVSGARGRTRWIATTLTPHRRRAAAAWGTEDANVDQSASRMLLVSGGFLRQAGQLPFAQGMSSSRGCEPSRRRMDGPPRLLLVTCGSAACASRLAAALRPWGPQLRDHLPPRAARCAERRRDACPPSATSDCAELRTASPTSRPCTARRRTTNSPPVATHPTPFCCLFQRRWITMGGIRRTSVGT